MDTCARESCNDYAWQASSSSFMYYVRRKLEYVENSHQVIIEQTPKKLTTEAVYMILLILSFILLAAIGSAITAFKYLLKNTGKKRDDLIREEVTQNRAATWLRVKTLDNSACKGWLKVFKSFFYCFCVFRNGRRILSTVPIDGHLNFLHGIRSLCLIWVLLCHIFLFCITSLGSTEDAKNINLMWYSQFILNGFFSVEGFIVISGFLNGFNFCKSYDKNRGNIKWVNFLLKRYLRLTPMHMIVLGFYATLFPHMGSGPIWPTYDTNPLCKNSWWYYPLYINNFQSYRNQCMSWAWSLAVEIQFFIISPLFLISMLRWPRMGYALTGATIFGSCFFNFVITKRFSLVDGCSRMGSHMDDFEEFHKRVLEYFDTLYVKPHARISSYLVGLALGYYLYRRGSVIVKTRTLTLYFGWIIFVISTLVGIFAMHFREESAMETAIYNGVKYLLSSYSFAWIIFVCFTGQGGFVNRLLSLKVFLPISSISFCTYLINMVVLMRYFLTLERRTDLSISLMGLLFVHLLLLIFAAAFVVSLFFEQPVLRLIDLSQAKVDKELKNR